MSSKTWLWRHVFLLFGVFVMTMLFLVLAAASLKTQDVWRGQYENLASQIERTDDRLKQLRGPLRISEDELSVPQLQAELSRRILERGRVWRNVRIADVNDDGIRLDLAAWNNAGCVRASVDDVRQDRFAEPAEAGEAVAAEPHRITESTLLHAFLEGPVTDLAAARQQVLFGDGDLLEQETRLPCSIPTLHLGHFVVTNAADNSVALQPVYPLTESQQAALDQGGIVTLYEVLPNDSHDVFAGLDEETLLKIFDRSEDLPAERIRGAIAEYLRDQTDARDEDPPERIRVKVKFLTSHSIEVDVEEGTVAEDDRIFDTRGRAIPPKLRLGKASSFQAGEVHAFDSLTASRLVQEGVAELVDEPAQYVRWLRNYDLIFRLANDARSDLEEALSTSHLEIASLTDQIAKVNAQIAYREEEKGKLQEDLSGFQRDLVAARQVREQLEQRRQAQVELLAQLFRSNLEGVRLPAAP